MKVVDLFSGCGGMSLGFQKAGFNIVSAFDNWEKAIEVYKKNFDHPIINCDLNHLEDFSIIKEFNPEMIIGGPPCQDFSSAGKRDESLGRSDLTIKFAEIVSYIKPKWFVMENVDRIVKTQTYRKAYQILEESEYGLTPIVLDASLCGVPQKRKRFFLIGEYKGNPDALIPYLKGNLSEKPTTVRDYLGDSLGVEYYYRHPRNYNRRGIFSIDEPAPTIRGVNRPVPEGYKGHPADPTPLSKDIRHLTTIERSYLQTFPENFIFEGSKTHLEQMIGNAVPVKLAEYVANCITSYLKDELKNKDMQLSLFA